MLCFDYDDDNAGLSIGSLILMRRFSGLIIVIGFILFPNFFAHAYRPFVTEDAGVAGKGVLQLEVSWDYLKWENDEKDNIFLFVPVIGVTERIELSVEIPYLFHNPDKGNRGNGIGDVSIVGKLLLIEEKSKIPGFTLKGIVKTESGDEEKSLGTGDEHYSIVAVMSKTIRDFQFHSMFGYTFIGNDEKENLRNIYLYGIGADYDLTEKISLVSEVVGNKRSDKKADHDPVSGMIGGILKVSDNLAFDAGVRFGFNNSAPDWNTTAGIAITF